MRRALFALLALAPAFAGAQTVPFSVFTNACVSGGGSSGTSPANTPAISHQFCSAYNSTTGAFTQTQPAFTDISGSVAASQLPNPSATTLGGIESYAAVTNQCINAISTSGVPSSMQLGFTNLSGTAS